jgi:hypothetical protein
MTRFLRLTLVCALGGGVLLMGCDDDGADGDAGPPVPGEDAGPPGDEDAGPPTGDWVDPTCEDFGDNSAQEDFYDDIAGERLDDDLMFNESAELMDAARMNTFDVDPMFSDIGPTAPSYVPGNAALPVGGTPVFNSNAPADFGDTTATYVGAIDPNPNGTDWTDGWTAFPDSTAVTGPSPGTCSGGDTVMVTGEITDDTTWACPNLYVLQGTVFVTNDATLTINAGVEILGDTAGGEAAALFVTRGAQINAEGTASEPIVFTSGANERATGDWAGVALLGSASTNTGTDCSTAGACEGGTGDFFENNLEGIDATDPRARYGGEDDASSCGTLRYVRIEFAGRELSPDNELNGLTLGGCGSGTTLDYVQVHRGKDDGIEFFGGTASLSHAVISGASDDSLDFDEGWRGNGQFIVIHQFEGLGDRGIESDNLGANEAATPRTEPKLWNVTMIGTQDNSWAVHREGMLGIMGNFLVHNYGSPVDIVANTEDPNNFWPDRLVYRNSVFNDVGTFPAEDLDEAAVCMEAQMQWENR